MDECKHGFSGGECDLCAPPPRGVNSTVFVTWGGSHFHNQQDCVALENGQLDAKDKGLETHPINRVSYASIKLTRSPCRTCVPRY